MLSFWDSSWKKVGSDRIAQYVKNFDLKPDRIIEYLLSHNIRSVCDAGCGCGIYSLKLIANRFEVSGFDISSRAVGIAKKLLESASAAADLKTANILSTGYEDGRFDAVISRDVIDHMPKKDGRTALRELYRITRPGGVVFVTLDHSDSEYESEPHTVNSDGDFVFYYGKWNGMFFHPYSEPEILHIIPPDAVCEIENSDTGITVKLIKPKKPDSDL